VKYKDKMLITVLAVLLVLWLMLALHYYALLVDYASHNYHIKYQALYIAVESWFLLCLVMITAVLLIALITATKFICPSST